MVEVTQADRELFITLSNADGQIAERILCGQAFTWEVEQIARHRLAEREAVIAWLRDIEKPNGRKCHHWSLANAIKAGEHLK